MSPRKRVFQDVQNCARCGKDHKRLLRKKFMRPPMGLVGHRYGYWLRCPTTGAPVLLRVDR